MKNSKISGYSSESKIMILFIKYGGESFRFNLHEEVKIREVDIQKELMGQPSSYSFLTMLHKKLITLAKEKEQAKKRVEAQRYIHYLTSPLTEFYKQNRKFPPIKLAEALTEADEEYQMAVDEAIKAESSRDSIEACVKSFEQRKEILQTLSANQRNEQRNT